MSEQILSQEEVGALLSAMENGDVALESAAKGDLQVESYDLTSKRIILHDQFAALDQVYDRLKTSLSFSLSSSLQRPINVEFVSSEMVNFGEIMSTFHNPTCFNLFGMEPLIGTSLLAIEPGLIFSLIDCMFGGDGKPLSEIREFTVIEQRMIKSLSNDVLKKWEKAWECVHSLKCSLKHTETKPEFVHPFGPDDSVIVTIFSINGEEFSGNIHWCISPLMLEPIKDRLSSDRLVGSDPENRWGALIQRLLTKTQINIAAELGKTTDHAVRDLLNLKLGDVIKLNTGPKDPVTIKVEDIPKYLGFPGILKGNRAVQISELLRQDGGLNKDG
jgi:flagellar motor switch protein FliM